MDLKKRVKLNMKNILIILSIFFSIVCSAQFAPAAEQLGSTAIFKDSSIIKAWATACVIERGLMQINEPDSGYAAVGDEFSAIGKAGENGIVSLGDGGKATLTFGGAVFNGPGADFCVFENSFADDFLELAFVEVSSNGADFVRFPATSLTQDTSPIGSFGLLDPTKLNNLAGKYRGLFGVPFDLEELKDSAQLDIQNITHIRLVDVVGSLLEGLARVDQFGHKINDPWPTLFPSSGFDLDAVGLIHTTVSNLNEVDAQILSLYPNPAVDQLNIMSEELIQFLQIISADGRVVKQTSINTSSWLLTIDDLQPGIYFLRVQLADGVVNTLRFVKQ
jgi:hypothetical protein